MTEHHSDEYEQYQNGQHDAYQNSAELSGWHPVQVTHLILGIAFLTFVGIWAALTADVVQSSDLRWLLPVPWLLGGSAGLVASVLGHRSRLERRRESQPYGG